jgi:hypothetical protein
MSVAPRLFGFARTPGGLWLGIGLFLALGGAAVGLWFLYRSPPDKPTTATSDDPRVTFATPFRNVRPEVRYVGDTRCVECHVQGKSYPHHPMGRSLAPLADLKLDVPAGDLFEKGGFLFRAELRDRQVVHSVSRRANGGELFGISSEVAYAIGSGTHGRSFLVNHDGYLFQSPITWFPQINHWDLSPGYAEVTLFDRPIKPGCLFCHASDPHPVPDTVNHYELSFPRGTAIGCERCHGPAELHLQARAIGRPPRLPDETIVNPARLEPALRDAVCEQCHLQGEARVPRRGRATFDYRPGLPLELFWSVFVRAPELTEGQKFVGHVEQMRSSVCAVKSGVKFGCISCHDPHQLPTVEQRVAYYRERCNSCHEHRPCSRLMPGPGDKDLQHQRENDCVACHMPGRQSTEVVHTTVIDHRILRRPGGAVPRPIAPQPGQVPLVAFYDHPTSLNPDASHDLGLALIDMAQQQPLPPQARLAVGRLAQPYLDEAVRRIPDDVAALEGRGLAFAMQGNAPRALADFQAVLARVPRREVSLVATADTAMALKRYPLAEEHWQKALAVNPWTARSHARLAEACAEQGKWGDALKECREALRLSPARESRRLLVTCLLRSGDRAGAEAEFRILVAASPGEEVRLRDWWAELTR